MVSLVSPQPQLLPGQVRDLCSIQELHSDHSVHPVELQSVVEASTVDEVIGVLYSVLSENGENQHKVHK